MEQTKKMYKKSDIKNAITAYNAKKSITNKLWALKESRSKIPTNDWLLSSLRELMKKEHRWSYPPVNQVKKEWSSNLSAGLESRISLPVPAKHSLTCLNKKADSKPPVLLYDISHFALSHTSQSKT